MPADEIVVLRAYAKYLRQIGFPLPGVHRARWLRAPLPPRL
jgi:NAD-specific glutamate dehydrogenase